MKKTRKTKQIAAFAAAVVMAACTAMPMSMMSASADDAKTYTIVVNTTDTAASASHTYKAYQIFKASSKADNGELSGIAWGAAISDAKQVDSKTIYQALKALGNLGTADSSIYFTEDGKEDGAVLTTAASVANVLANISGGTGNDVYAADKVAAVFAAYVGDATATVGADTGTTTVTNADTNAVTSRDYVLDVTSAGLGYYLVTDTLNDGAGDPETISKYILRVSGNGTDSVTITPKTDSPKMIKKIKENNKTISSTTVSDFSGSSYDVGTGYNDTADYNIGDAVPFKLYGTLPTTYDSYETYKYVFHDTLGTQFDAPQDIVVKAKIGDTEYILTDGYTILDNDTTTETGSTYDAASDATCTIEVSFANLKSGIKGYATNADSSTAADLTITKDTVITVEYTAVLNDTAVIGQDGQTNEAYLEYSRNPYNSGEGTDSTNNTPTDKVIAFTYELDVTKIDGATKAALAGAQFKLKATTGEHTNQYAVLTLTNGKYYVTGWDTESNATVMSGQGTDGNQFYVVGLDDGTYTLFETKTPTGFNTPSADGFTFTISANTSNSQTDDNIDGKELTSLKLYGGAATTGDALVSYTYTADGSSSGEENSLTADEITANAALEVGALATNIENNSGATLPSTGGIGTTVFYVTGGVLVAGAGVLLITKKRTKKDDAE
jgi:fimbrial isopeptide formation D2 family protein/LPXTG-motif cell wall-anchored protein